MANLTNITLPNFVGGEVSQLMGGRTDIDLFAKSMLWCKNFVPLPQGGSSYRPGSSTVGLTRGMAKCSLIPFQFSANDAYMIAATAEVFRFYRNDGVVLNVAKTITAIDNGSQVQVTAAAHGFANGAEIFITGVDGMPEINDRFYIVSDQATNTFKLKDAFNNYVNAQTYGTYQYGGSAATIYELATPYAEVDLELLRTAQTADLMYLTHRGYAPRKLVRSGHTSWAINTYSRTNDPFTGSTKWPAVVSFMADGRLAMANTADNPEGVWESRTPDGTTTRYDDYTVGTDASNAVIFNLAPVEGVIDAIQEMRPFGRQFVLLGASSIRRLYGATQDTPPIPEAINTQPTIEGSARVRPVVIGTTMLFVDVGGKKLKGFKYNLSKDDFESVNYQLVAEQLSSSSFKKIIRVKGDPDAVWVLRSDGVLLSFTYNDNENIAGWARHYAGGDGIVEDIQTIRRDTGQDQLWLVVKRVLNGKTYRTIEVMSAWPSFPERMNYYTGSEKQDEQDWANVTWEATKSPQFLDASLTFNGAARGITKNATLTPSGTAKGATITITSNNAVFLDTHIGREIWKKYETDGSGGGRVRIDAYLSSTQVSGVVLSDFDNANAILPGDWEFAIKEVKNLQLYEGVTVGIQADGSAHPERTVTAGKVELQTHSSVIHVGFGYQGLMITQNIDIGGTTGPANSKPRNITRVRARVKDTVGGKVGPNAYKLKELVYRKPTQIAGRVPPPYTGMKESSQLDGWDANAKRVVWRHDDPTPNTLLALDVECLTVDQT